MEDWFNDRKAAQVAAFFCEKAGGNLPVLKLIKLVYLSDRKFLSETGYSITNDQHVSMPHGPVNSITRDLIEGNEESEDWSGLISGKANHEVGLSRAYVEADDTDEMSDAEVETLASIWGEFGGMGRWEIRDWTHENCPEWEDPNGSSNPIPVERILKFLGFTQGENLAKRHAGQREFRAALKGLDQEIAF